jgi:hypothetical protein
MPASSGLSDQRLVSAITCFRSPAGVVWGPDQSGLPSFRMSQNKSCPSVDTVAHSVPVLLCQFAASSSFQCNMQHCRQGCRQL